MYQFQKGRPCALRSGLVAGVSGLAIALTLGVASASAQTAPAPTQDDDATQVDELSRAALPKRRPMFEAGFISGSAFSRADVLLPVARTQWT